MSELRKGDVFSGEMVVNSRKGLRTRLQNAAMWLFNTNVAKAFNDAGMDMRAVLKPDYFVSWSKDSVKEHIWNVFSVALFNTDKSSKLDTKQFCEVGENMGKQLAEKKGIVVHWPSRESLMMEMDNK